MPPVAAVPGMAPTPGVPSMPTPPINTGDPATDALLTGIRQPGTADEGRVIGEVTDAPEEAYVPTKNWPDNSQRRKI
jgi:hypothetical protein